MEEQSLDVLISNGIIAVIILAIANLVVRVLRGWINRLEARDVEDGTRRDGTRYNFLKNSIGIVVYSIAFILVLNLFPAMKRLGTALFAGAGVIAAIVGFASQQAFSNIISGIFILIFKPFRLGDTVELKGSVKGVIMDITLRHTIIKDYENRRIIIPNSIISNDTIINSTINDERIRKHIEFGIGYDANIDKAIGIIQEEIIKHPLAIDGRTLKDQAEGLPQVVVKVVNWADSAIELRAYAWSEGNDNAFTLKCDVLKSVKERFDKEGIDIPFPHRTLVHKSK